MKFMLLTLIVFIGMNVSHSNVALAQEVTTGIRSSLFAKVDKALQQAKERNAILLSPMNYQNGIKLYQEADRALKRGDNLQAIQRKLDEAMNYFERANEATKLAEVTFESAISARNDAMKVNANKFATDEWKNAEKEFSDATKKLESGDARNAKKGGDKAEGLYRKSELVAIQANILSPSRSVLKGIDRKNQVPITYGKANQMVEESESMLKNNRYETGKARNLALQAEYEARHAQYLNEYIQGLNNERKSREEVILAFENEIRKVADELQMPSQFDKGYGQVTNSIVERIKILNDSLQQQRQKNQNLLSENSELKTKMENLTKERAQISEQVESMSGFQARFNSVRNLFSSDEALVFRDQNDAVIRLVGFNFDFGSSVIKPDHYGILTKVQRAIEMFPGSKVIIQGHTDSQGSDTINLKLSQSRANAVMTYLLANMNIEQSRLEAIGFGESRPIANNETEQGRKLNRRIDIIIKPVSSIGSK